MGQQMAEIFWLTWDENNEQHLAEHGVVPREVRELLGNEHVTTANPAGGRDRVLLIGRTNGGRFLTISMERTDDPGTWKPITGWTSTPPERRLL